MGQHLHRCDQLCQEDDAHPDHQGVLHSSQHLQADATRSALCAAATASPRAQAAASLPKQIYLAFLSHSEHALQCSEPFLNTMEILLDMTRGPSTGPHAWSDPACLATGLNLTEGMVGDILRVLNDEHSH